MNECTFKPEINHQRYITPKVVNSHHLYKVAKVKTIKTKSGKRLAGEIPARKRLPILHVDVKHGVASHS